MSSVALTPPLQALVVRTMPMVEALAHRRCRKTDPSRYEELVGIGNTVLVELAPQHDPDQGTFEAFASKRVRGAMIDYLRKIAPGRGGEGNITPLTLAGPLREVDLMEAIARDGAEYADVLDTLSAPAFGMYASYMVGGIRDMRSRSWRRSIWRRAAARSRASAPRSASPSRACCAHTFARSQSTRSPAPSSGPFAPSSARCRRSVRNFVTLC